MVALSRGQPGSAELVLERTPKRGGARAGRVAATLVIAVVIVALWVSFA